MKSEQLQEILAAHTQWLYGKGDERADLQDANLQDADLQRADLQYANLQDADLQRANLQDADLQRANLRSANLQDADLQGANLRSADLDFSVWPLWCGSVGAIVDDRIQRQLLYHAYATDNPEQDADIAELFQSELFRRVIARFHRFDECGGFRDKQLEEGTK
jgi:uncharacterized protein YjbI with pentapeptide repeats